MKTKLILILAAFAAIAHASPYSFTGYSVRVVPQYVPAPVQAPTPAPFTSPGPVVPPPQPVTASAEPIYTKAEVVETLRAKATQERLLGELFARQGFTTAAANFNARASAFDEAADFIEKHT